MTSRNVRNPLLILAVLLALTLAVPSVRSRLGGGRMPAGPFGGTTREWSGDRVVLTGLQVTARPTWAQLAAAFAPFRAAHRLELDGLLALPGAEPAAFTATVTPGPAAGGGRLELQTRLNEQPFTLTGGLDGATGRVKLRFSGCLAERDLRAFGIATPEEWSWVGVAELSGEAEFNPQDWSLAAVPRLSGRFLPGARLNVPPVRLLNPGEFSLREADTGGWVVSLPEAEWNLPPLCFRAPECSRGADGAWKIAARLELLPPVQLSAPLKLSGEFRPATGAWSWETAPSGPLVLSTPASTARLDRLTVRGQGGRTGGEVTFAAVGESLALRPESGAAVLWSGVGLQLDGRRTVKIDAAGNPSGAGETVQLKFRRFDLSDSGRNLMLENFSVEVRHRSDADTLPAFAVAADTLTMSQAGVLTEQLTLTRPQFSGRITVSDGRLLRLDGASGKAAALTMMRDGVELAAEAPAMRAEADRLRDSGENLVLEATAGRTVVRRGDDRLEAARASWRLGAEIARGFRRPAVWHHRFGVEKSVFRLASAHGEIDRLEMRIALNDNDLSLRKGTGSLTGVRGEFHPARVNADRFPERWRFLAEKLAVSTERYLDGWQGELQLTGGGLAAADRPELTLADIALRLPFAPAAAAGPAAGLLTVGKVAGGGLIDSIRAELTAHGGDLRWRGNTTSARLGGGGFFFTGALERTDGAWTLPIEYNLPLTALTGAVPASAVLPLPAPWRYRGRLGAAGTLRIGPREVTLRHADELAGDLENGQTTIAGVTGTFREDGASRLRFSGISAPQWSCGDGETSWLPGGFGWRLAAADLAAAGGVWKLAREVKWEPGSAPALDFEVTGIAASALLPELAGGLDAPLSGTVRLRWGAGGPELAGAELAAGGALLKLAGLEKFRVVPAKADPVLFEFAAASWREFRASACRVRIRRADGALLLRIAADGHPVQPVPFVYEGDRFRPAAAGEYGFAGEVSISGDYRLPRPAAGKGAK